MKINLNRKRKTALDLVAELHFENSRWSIEDIEKAMERYRELERLHFEQLFLKGREYQMGGGCSFEKFYAMNFAVYSAVSDDNGLTCEIDIVSDELDGSVNYMPVLGGDSTNPSWSDFLNQFDPKYIPHISLIRKCVEKNNISGKKACDYAETHTFKFSDGSNIAFTLRGWADLMQSIADKNEGYLKYYR